MTDGVARCSLKRKSGSCKDQIKGKTVETRCCNEQLVLNEEQSALRVELKRDKTRISVIFKPHVNLPADISVRH